MASGYLITIEGIDGSGKSSLAKNIIQKLNEKNIATLITQEPGGSELGKKLRTILHTEKEKLCDLAEYLLFAADRAQHFTQVVIPALKENKIVISDRMADSSLAYQGYGRGLDIKNITLVNAWAMQNIQPNLVIYLKLDIKTALNRVGIRGEELTTFEKEKQSFWESVLNGYEIIFKTHPNVIELDGTLSQEELCESALKEIESVCKL